VPEPRPCTGDQLLHELMHIEKLPKSEAEFIVAKTRREGYYREPHRFRIELLPSSDGRFQLTRFGDEE
jgi:hypothetical protein